MKRALVVLLAVASGCLDLDPRNYRFESPAIDGGTDAGVSSTQLVMLASSVGALSPDFSASVTHYTVAVPPSTPSVTLTPTAADAAATIEVQGTPTASGTASQALGLVDGAGTFSIVVSNGGESTPYEVVFVAQLPVEKAYLPATLATDHFGTSVALSGDTLAVGAFGEGGSSGAVYVYVRDGASWTQQAWLKASNANAMDTFGHAVAIDGDTLVVGASAEDSAATTVDGDQANNAASSSGAAYVFVRTGMTWTQQAYLKSSNTAADARFGTSVAISGDVVAVGASGDASAGTNTGGVYVFARTGTTWTQQAALRASNAAARAAFGTRVALSGDTLAVGAPYEATGSSQSGAVYVFVHGSTWTEQRLLKASDAAAYDYFGSALSLDGDTLAVGAYGKGGSLTFHRGGAYVFVRSNARWDQQAVVAPLTPADSDEFGVSLALSGNTLLALPWPA